MKLYVIMANDYPQGVFNAEDKARDFCKVANDAERELQRDARGQQHPISPIYYKFYEFTLNEVTRVR